MADAFRLACLILLLTALFLINLQLNVDRIFTINQKSSLVDSFGGLAASFSNIGQRKFVKARESTLRHRCFDRRYLFILFLLTSNDIQPNPGPTSSSILKCCSLNARSIANKRTELQAVVSTMDLDIIAISETWLNSDIMDQELLSSDYNIFRKDRLGKGGGVLLATREGICCYRRCDLETACEILWCEVHLSPYSIYYVGVFYRPPSSDVAYLANLVQSLEKLPSSCNILLLGDFNLPNIDWNLVSPCHPDTISDFFCDCIINCFGFSQLVDKPTRGRALLDLILTNTPERLSNVDVNCGLGNSDHNTVYFDFNVFISRPSQAPKIVYDYKNANWKDFRSDLSKAPWDSVFLQNNIEQMWNKWKELFFAAAHNNISKRHLKKRRNVPWLTSAIRRLFHKRKRLWKKAKLSQLQSDWEKYRQCRNNVKSELNKSYWHHIQSLKNSDNPKRFWSFIKSKTKSR